MSEAGGEPAPQSSPQSAPQSQPAPPPTPPPQYTQQSEPGARRTPQDQIAELRAEAAQWRISYRQAQEEAADARARAERAAAELESAKTSAVAPLTAKLGRARQSIMDAEIHSHLVALGLQDPDLIGLAARMPDAPKVEVDDEFQVRGAREFAEAFKKWKPQFFEAPRAPDDPKKPKAPAKTSSGGEPEGGGGTSDPPTVDVSKMSKQDYAKYKSDTLRAFRQAGMVGR